MERATRCGTVRLHPKLSREDEHANLRVHLADLARELESGLRSFEGLSNVALGEDLGLRRLDRCKRPVAFRLLGQTARASETLACPGEVPVIDIESRGVVERARHLIEKPELLINIEALLAGHDCGLDVTAVVVRLRDTGVQRCGCWQIAELVR